MSCEKSLKKYNARVKQQMDEHKLERRLAKVSWEAGTYPASKVVAKKLERLEKQMREI